MTRADFRNPGSTGVRHDGSGARRFCLPKKEKPASGGMGGMGGMDY
jgi:hypothetical protein